MAWTVLLLCCCHRADRLSSLSEIADYVSYSPQKALAALDSIDYGSLSPADRHYYDFLSIKANDKAYVKHTSDSLILDVIDHYSSQSDDALYAEALYYGGRVYSDLGDYPSALKYFQKSLKRLPDTDGCLNLKFRLLSRTGRLLNILRLYDESEKYLKLALETERILNDSIAEVYDLNLIGNSATSAERYYEADCYFNEAIAKSKYMDASIRAKSSMNLALLKYKTGQIDSALSLIRGVPDSVVPVSRNTALAYAAKIYLKAGIIDTAFMYAKELVSSEDSYNKQSGYYVILSPELRSMSDSKTIEQYVNDYGSSLENLLNSNSNQLALIQQASYNYNKHIENNERLERRNHRLKIMIAALVATLLLICVAYLYKQNRYKTRIIELQNAVRNIDLVREDLISKAKGTADSNMDAEKMAESIPNEDDLIEELKAKLTDIAKNPAIDRKTPQEIILSDTYKKYRSI